MIENKMKEKITITSFSVLGPSSSVLCGPRKDSRRKWHTCALRQGREWTSLPDGCQGSWLVWPCDCGMEDTWQQRHFATRTQRFWGSGVSVWWPILSWYDLKGVLSVTKTVKCELMFSLTID